MNITKPEEMLLDSSQIEEVVREFEKCLSNEEKNRDYYHLVISNEYSRRILDEIEKLYKHAGWSKVICRTSSENGERGGLTGLQLYR